MRSAGRLAAQTSGAARLACGRWRQRRRWLALPLVCFLPSRAGVPAAVRVRPPRRSAIAPDRPPLAAVRKRRGRRAHGWVRGGVQGGRRGECERGSGMRERPLSGFSHCQGASTTIKCLRGSTPPLASAGAAPRRPSVWTAIAHLPRLAGWWPAQVTRCRTEAAGTVPATTTPPIHSPARTVAAAKGGEARSRNLASPRVWDGLVVARYLPTLPPLPPPPPLTSWASRTGCAGRVRAATEQPLPPPPHTTGVRVVATRLRSCSQAQRGHQACVPSTPPPFSPRSQSQPMGSQRPAVHAATVSCVPRPCSGSCISALQWRGGVLRARGPAPSAAATAAISRSVLEVDLIGGSINRCRSAVVGGRRSHGRAPFRPLPPPHWDSHHA